MREVTVLMKGKEKKGKLLVVERERGKRGERGHEVRV